MFMCCYRRQSMEIKHFKHSTFQHSACTNAHDCNFRLQVLWCMLFHEASCSGFHSTIYVRHCSSSTNKAPVQIKLFLLNFRFKLSFNLEPQYVKVPDFQRCSTSIVLFTLHIRARRLYQCPFFSITTLSTKSYLDYEQQMAKYYCFFC